METAQLPRPTSNDIMALLQKGLRFKPGSKLAHLMRAFHEEVVDIAKSELETYGFIEMKLHNGRVLKYNFDSATSSWNQVI